MLPERAIRAAFEIDADVPDYYFASDRDLSVCSQAHHFTQQGCDYAPQTLTGQAWRDAWAKKHDAVPTL